MEGSKVALLETGELAKTLADINSRAEATLLSHVSNRGVIAMDTEADRLRVAVGGADVSHREIAALANAAAAGLVCWYDADAITMTPALWGRVHREHLALGRTLTGDEVAALAGADGGDNGHA